MTAIKLLTTRTRPDVADLLTAAPGIRLPDGAQAVDTYSVIATCSPSPAATMGPRVSAWMVAILIMTLVGFSRRYLGAHWLTDVRGGYTLGAEWTALAGNAAATSLSP